MILIFPLWLRYKYQNISSFLTYKSELSNRLTTLVIGRLCNIMGVKGLKTLMESTITDGLKDVNIGDEIIKFQR